MRKYFCGWYFRCQSDYQTLAIIPSIHRTKHSNFSAIQLITDDVLVIFIHHILQQTMSLIIHNKLNKHYSPMGNRDKNHTSISTSK